ncbi:MAG: hypothetical protein ABIJ05_02665 [Patescibacteria group bacterium]
MKNQKGQAAILIIFVLGMMTLLIGLTLIKTGYGESLMGRRISQSTKAFYMANSGVEDALFKIATSGFGYPDSESFEINFEGGKAKVKVSATGKDERIIESVGIYANYLRKIKVIALNTSLKPGFLNAIHAGLGGVELRNLTLVAGKDDADGNVYSNSYIKGAKNDHTSTGECKNASSIIDGSAWAHTNIEKLAENDSGVCINKDAHAENLNNCYINGIPFSPNTVSSECPSGNSLTNEEAPDILSLPDMGVDIMKNYLSSKGTIFAGDCILDGSGGPRDCSNGTKVIGNLIIAGNLIKPSNLSFNISGPVWVKGNITLNSLGAIGLTSDIKEISQIVLTSGKIISNSNLAYNSNGKAFLLFISEYQSTNSNICDDPAITISSNANSVLFYSKVACILVNANSTFHGAILGEAIRVDNNSTVEYDPALQNAIFGLTKSGGWQIVAFAEE